MRKLTRPVHGWQVSLLLVAPSLRCPVLPCQELSLGAAGPCFLGARLRPDEPPLLSHMEISSRYKTQTAAQGP